MKIGLFGGTFNPFHNGHIGISQYVRDRLALDCIFFIPSATPPHKPDSDLAPAPDRFHMVEKSIRSFDRLLVSDKELNRKGPSYTIDTVRSFMAEYAPDTRFYLLMGTDAFLDINTWKATRQLFETVTVVIMLRSGWGSPERIAAFVNEHISDQYRYNDTRNRFFHPDQQEIIICQVPVIDISSTMVRERVRNKLAISDLVPLPVEEMIKKKELYS